MKRKLSILLAKGQVKMFSRNSMQNIFLLLTGVVLFQSYGCTPYRELIYLSDLADSTNSNLSQAVNTFESPIQKNDQLWITVGGTNLEDLASLNSGNGVIAGSNMGNSSGQENTSILGYLVEADGTIKLPYLGKLNAAGMTRMELEKVLTEKLQDYTKNPVVNIRFMNYRVTVLGEVNSPGSISFPSERLTLLEALGLAGDLTKVGNRKQVLVIRETNGTRDFGRVNLAGKNLFHSPYYYLKTNDIVYVEPTAASTVQRERLPQYVGMIAGLISLAVTFVYVLK